MRRFRWILVLLLAPLLKAASPDASVPRLVFPNPHGDPAIHLLAVAGGELALSGTKTGQIKLWDVVSGTELRTLTLTLGDEELVALLPRHATQAYAVCTRRVVIVELPSLDIASAIDSPQPIQYATVSPDGESLWVAGTSYQNKHVHVLRRGRFPLRKQWEQRQPIPSDGVFRPDWGIPVVSNDGRYALIQEYGETSFPSCVSRTAALSTRCRRPQNSKAATAQAMPAGPPTDASFTPAAPAPMALSIVSSSSTPIHFRSSGPRKSLPRVEPTYTSPSQIRRRELP